MSDTSIMNLVVSLLIAGFFAIVVKLLLEDKP